MIRQVATVTAFLYFISAASINSIDGDIPPEYRELIPEKVKHIILTVSEGDKEVIRAMARDYVELFAKPEVVAELKEKAAELEEKLTNMHAMLKTKIEALEDDEAKAFINEIISDARKLHASIVAGNTGNVDDVLEHARQALDKYKLLSDRAKEDLQKELPGLTFVFKNENFEDIAYTLLATI